MASGVASAWRKSSNHVHADEAERDGFFATGSSILHVHHSLSSSLVISLFHSPKELGYC